MQSAINEAEEMIKDGNVKCNELIQIVQIKDKEIFSDKEKINLLVS